MINRPTKANGVMIKCKASGNISGLTEAYMRVNGWKIVCMEKEFRLKITMKPLKETSNKIASMDMGFLIREMEEVNFFLLTIISSYLRILETQ